MYLRKFYPMLPVSILGLLLGSPLILWAITHLDSGNKMLVAFGFVVSFFWVLFFFLLPFSQRRIHLVALPLYVISMAELFTLVFFETRIDSGFILTILSNMTDATEFLTAYGFDLLKILVPFFVLYVVAWRLLPKDLCLVSQKRFSLMTLIGLFALYGFAGNQEHDTDPYRLMIFALGKDISSPMAVFSQGYVAHHLATTSKDAREHRQSDRLQAKNMR